MYYNDSVKCHYLATKLQLSHYVFSKMTLLYITHTKNIPWFLSGWEEARKRSRIFPELAKRSLGCNAYEAKVTKSEILLCSLCPDAGSCIETFFFHPPHLMQSRTRVKCGVKLWLWLWHTESSGVLRDMLRVGVERTHRRRKPCGCGRSLVQATGWDTGSSQGIQPCYLTLHKLLCL